MHIFVSTRCPLCRFSVGASSTEQMCKVYPWTENRLIELITQKTSGFVKTSDIFISLLFEDTSEEQGREVSCCCHQFLWLLRL